MRVEHARGPSCPHQMLARKFILHFLFDAHGTLKSTIECTPVYLLYSVLATLESDPSIFSIQNSCFEKKQQDKKTAIVVR